MKLPQFVGQRALKLPAVPLAGASSKALAFLMQAQLQSNWCWAATSSSVSQYYAAGSPWSQCKVADATLTRIDCCSAGGASGPCNVTGYLDRALTTTGNLAKPIVNSTELFSTVQTEVNADRPLGCRIGWFSNGGHFVAVFGWQRSLTNVDYVDVADPIYGNSHVTYSSFCSSYRNAGRWTHSYFTKP